MMKMMLCATALFACMAAAPTAAPAAAARPVAPRLLPMDRVIGTDALLYVESAGDWYEARMASPCHGLPDVRRLQIVMGPSGRLDNTSTVIARGERCGVAAVKAVAGPPPELLLNGDS
jgi:hypothetical protein